MLPTVLFSHMFGGIKGRPEVWVARSSSVIFVPLYCGTFTTAEGRCLSIGSPKLMIPCFTMSAKTRVVKVFVIESILKMVLPLTGMLLAFETFPKLYTFVPSGSTKPMTLLLLIC